MIMSKLHNILIEITNKGSEYNEIIDNLIAPNFHYKDDLIAEIAISFLSRKDKLEEVIEQGYFKYYFIMTVKNQVHSSTSIFHKQIRLQDKIKIDEDIQIEDIVDEYGMEYKMEMEDKYEQTQWLRKNTKMNYFESEMMRLYFDEAMTYRAIAEEYEINHTLVFKTIKDVLQRLKKQMD